MVNVKALLWLMTLVGGGGLGFWYCLGAADRKLLGLRPIALVLALLPCVAFMPNVWLLDALIFVSVPLLARTRSDGAALFLACFLLLPSLNAPLSIGSMYVFGVPALHVLALSLLLVTLIHPAPGSTAPLGRRNDLAFLLFFLVILLINMRGRLPLDVARWGTERTLTLALPYLVLVRAVRTRADIRRMLLVLGMVGAALAAEAVFETRRGWPLFRVVEQHFGFDPLVWMHVAASFRGGMIRASTTFEEAISFSFFLSLTLLATLAMRDAFRSKAAHYAVLGLIAVGLYYSGSRGGWLASVLGILLVDVYSRRYASAVAKIAVMAVGAFLLVTAAHNSDWLGERLGLTGHGQGTIDYREQLARRGMEEFHKAPVLGRSDPEVRASLVDMIQGEHIIDFVNYWLYFLLTSGIVGVVVIATGMLMPVVRVALARVRLRGQPGLLAVGSFLFAGGLTPVAALFFSSLGDRFAVVWSGLFALSAVFLAGLPRAQARAPEERSPTRPEDAPALHHLETQAG